MDKPKKRDSGAPAGSRRAAEAGTEPSRPVNRAEGTGSRPAESQPPLGGAAGRSRPHPAGGDAIIRIQGLCKIYNPGPEEVRALDGVSLTVAAGEFVAIVGRSGSGKSTLMNLLGCLDSPSEGSYFLEGQDVARLTDDELSEIRNRHIGFIFQGFHLIPSLDALENVELPLIYRGMGREQRRRIARESLERVGLGHRLHHRPAEMSGGQQQRVAIARAIAARPPILLADEPTGNLDTASGQEIIRILQSLHAEGRTVILITHDNGIAAAAQRIIRIEDGRVAEDSAGGLPAGA